MNKMKMIKMALVFMGGVMYAELSVEQGKQIEEGISRYLAARYEDEFLRTKTAFLFEQLSKAQPNLDLYRSIIIKEQKVFQADFVYIKTTQQQYDTLKSELLSVQQKREDNSQPDNILREITAILNAEKKINVSDIIAKIQKCGEIERSKVVTQLNIQEKESQKAIIQKLIGKLYNIVITKVWSQEAHEANIHIASYITQQAKVRAEKEILENSIAVYEQQEQEMITEIMNVINQYVVMEEQTA